MAKNWKRPEDRPFALNEAELLKLFKSVKKPLSRAEVIRQLRLPKRDKKVLRGLLDDLVRRGTLIRIRRAYGLAGAMRCVTGRLEVQRGGFGFVVPEDARRKDIFISQRDLGGAWHGDKVVASIVREGHGARNHEGRIVRILERGRKTLPVRVYKQISGGDWACRPSDPHLGFGIICTLADESIELQRGDIALCEPGDQLDPGMWEGRILSRLGRETDVPVQEALVKSNHGIRTRFPSGSRTQAEALPEVPAKKDMDSRKDLQSLPFVTIDGASARDFDDAVMVERHGKGYRLWVAIADVSHYVGEGTPLDREALERGNSYYFPQSVEPMFPERLSNGLCSLNPDVPRLAMVVCMNTLANGIVESATVLPAVIRSHARLTYGQVKRAVLDREQQERENVAHVLPMLELAEELARKMNRLRHARGSLDFDIPEPEILFNVDGETVDIRPRTRHFGHQMIEEFMIAANEAVARFLGEKGLPCMYRIHPEPDEEKLARLFRLLSLSDPTIAMPKEFTPKVLQELNAQVAGTDKEFLVHRLMIRSMKQAKYSPENDGHFGLASEDYCHFTSPIRRYADLVVHRLVKAALDSENHPVPGRKKLFNVANHISGRERVAMDAERETIKRLTALFMRDRQGGTFNAVVSQLMDFGFRVELTDVLAEGMVRLSSLEDDYYAYWPHREMIVGERTGRAFRLGQTVEVVLEEVNLDRLELNFTLRSVVAASQDYKDLM